MGHWETIQKNDWIDHVRSFVKYEKFPIEIRAVLAKFLHTNKIYLDADVDNPAEHGRIREFIDLLKSELERIIEKMTTSTHDEFGANHLQGNTIRNQFQHIKAIYMESIDLFKVIKETLDKEAEEVTKLQKYLGNAPALPGSSAGSPEITTEKTFAERSQEINDSLRKIEHNMLQQIRNAIQEYDAELRESANSPSQIPIGEQWHFQSTKLDVLVGLIFNVVVSLREAQRDILDILASFNDEHRTASLLNFTCSGERNRQLDVIEQWFGSLARLDSELEKILPDYDRLCAECNYTAKHPGSYVQRNINELKNERKNERLVFEVQPKQLMRTQTNTNDVKFRILPYGLSENISRNNVKFAFVIISDETARQVCSPNYSSQELPEPALTFETKKKGEEGPKRRKVSKKQKDDGSRSNVFVIPGAKLAEVKRDKPRGFTLEQRVWMYIQVKINEETYTKLSLPIWVTSHTNQLAKPWTQMIWYNAFPTASRVELDVPNQMPLRLLFDAINLQFLALGSENEKDRDKYGLSDAHKNYLEEIIPGKEMIKGEIMVTKSGFCEVEFSQIRKQDKSTSEISESDEPVELDNLEAVRTEKIPFGEWIYLCLNFLSWKPSSKKSHAHIRPLKDYWKEGRIVGFMSAENVLKSLKSRSDPNDPKVCMLRFPEKWADFIGLYVYNWKAQAVWKQLYSTRDFDKIPMEDLIRYTEFVSHLYCKNGQIIPKEKALSQIKSPKVRLTTGNYFRSIIRQYFPGSFLAKWNVNDDSGSGGSSSEPSPRVQGTSHDLYPIGV